VVRRTRRTGADAGGPAGTALPGKHVVAEVTVTVSLKKVLTWLVVAFVVFYVIKAPDQSAQLVRNAGHALGDAASSLASFVGSLV
jgi:hypothetical protein